MKVVAMIPARYGSTRFPAKMLAPVLGVPLIVRTYKNIIATGLFEDVIVVTDSDEIENVIKDNGGKVLRSRIKHDCGTDRIAEVAGDVDADIIINVQGDEPFLDAKPLELVIALFKDSNINAASLVSEMSNIEEINDPNKVKVVLDKNSFAIYFSRSPIPFQRNPDINVTYYKHIGIYAFRKEALIQFAKWGKSPLESVEALECNRFVDNKMPLAMAVTNHETIAIDTSDDLLIAEQWLKEQ